MKKTTFTLLASLLLIFSCKSPSNEAGSASKEMGNDKNETIFFDKETGEWKDSHGKCNTCTFENGFNPNGWLLSDSEKELVPAILEAEAKYGIDLKQNRISSKEELEKLIAEFNAESSEQNQQYESVDIAELNKKLAAQDRELEAKEVMELYYPYKVEENGEGNESISIMNPRTRNGLTYVTLIHNNMLDDAIKAMKIEMAIAKKDSKWEVNSIKKNWACWEGRGQENWGTQICK